ncbi:hypothetical protein Clacol_008054 [Clathrus columnatus]|uniref:HNH nuclease domain-containing protein n=1 Tax=Clathrus columnatus TaxID=1419009 RepID=A0AAV5AJC9_9AGAM|nr:hypothetical protein Clacol_008054 [Clathrus columnatus]
MPSSLPSAGYVQLNLEGSLTLNISIIVIRSCCTRPFLYLRYVGWCILGAIGELQDSEGNAVDLDTEDIDEETIYNYQTDTGLEHAIDPEVTRLHSSVATTKTDVRINFKQLLSERDGNCVWTNADVSDGMHLIPFARGDEWLQRIVENRFHEGDDEEDLADIQINDIRNGILGNSIIHELFDRRDVAVLKTPNPIIQCQHIPAMHQRELPEDVSYPQGSRFLLTRAGVPRPEPPPKVSTGLTRKVGDRNKTIEKLERARQARDGGQRRQQGGEALDAEAIVLHFWANTPAARERRAKKEADHKERVKSWRAGVISC